LAKGRVSSQQLRHDPLMDQYMKSSGWVKERSRPLATVIVIVAAVIAVGLLVRWVINHRAASAGESLAEAYKVNDAIVANPLPPSRNNDYAFTTEEEKHHKAYEAFEKAARDYSSYNGDLGRYLAATHQLYFDAPKAEATLKELSTRDSMTGGQARLALAQRYEATGRYPEALEEYQKLKAAPRDVPAELIELNIAETLEEMGKKQEASDAYFALISKDRNSPVATVALTRLTTFDPARAEKLPPIAPAGIK
jgi:tetratricopeptide (TPR) repeat protein